MNRIPSSILAAALVLGAGASTLGCLEADVQQTIYLEPDGSLTSEIVGLNIRSDRTDPAARLEEEREFLDDLRGGVYERDLFPSGAVSVTTTLLRGERPYTVVMTGRYRRADEFFARTLESCFDATVLEARLDHLGDETRLVVAVWTGEEDSEPDVCALAGDGDDACADSEPPDDSVRIILTEGRFVEAEGFEIDGDLAIPLPEECVAVRRGVRTYSLTWTTAHDGSDSTAANR